MPEFEVNVNINEDAISQFQARKEEALRDVGDFLVSEMKKIAPVDTGEFMRSIDWAKIDSDRIIIGSSDKPGKVWALEHGHSDQAPNGVFEVTINRNKGRIKSIFASRMAE